MNFTTKALVAAIALAGASSANATLQLTSSGNSSIVLAVWDDVRRVSYVRDLGINLLDFLHAVPADVSYNFAGMPTPSAATFRSFATDALFATTFGESNTADIRWGVVGGERSGRGNLVATRTDVITTTSATGIAIGGAGAVVDAIFGDANTNLTAGFTSWATDNISTLDDGRAVNGGRLLDGVAFAGTWFGGLSDTLNFLNYRSATTAAAAGTVQAYAGVFSLSADGTLHFVPVPAAVWLLGSALVGMAGVARRRAA